MSSPNGRLRRYRVVVLGEPAEQLRRWGGWASEVGGRVHEDYRRTLVFINNRLSRYPLLWGEPLYRLRSLGLRVFMGSYLMLNAWYAVSEAEGVVYLNRVRFVYSYPHGSPPAE